MVSLDLTVAVYNGLSDFRDEVSILSVLAPLGIFLSCLCVFLAGRLTGVSFILAPM